MNRTISDDRLFELLRAADPLADEPERSAPDTEAALDRLLARGQADTRRRRVGWARRRLVIGGFAFSPAVALGVVAATAAAATGAVALSLSSATAIFQANPQAMPQGSPSTESVLGATVREITSVDLPGYGRVQFWGASTQQGGFCQALKLPDGHWGGIRPDVFGGGGFYSGSLPGCLPTQQQQVLAEPAVARGQQPSADTGQDIGPIPLQAYDTNIKGGDGRQWSIWYGFVETQGSAVSVRDTVTGTTGTVTKDGFFMTAVPEPSGTNLNGDYGHIEAVDAAGNVLTTADYTYGAMLPGYQPGPTGH